MPEGDEDQFKKLNDAHEQMLLWAEKPQYTTRKALQDCWSYDGFTSRWSPRRSDVFFLPPKGGRYLKKVDPHSAALLSPGLPDGFLKISHNLSVADIEYRTIGISGLMSFAFLMNHAVTNCRGSLHFDPPTTNQMSAPFSIFKPSV